MTDYIPIALTDRQCKLLKLLNLQIATCERCNLYKGGRCLPYWTPGSKYVIVGEAPGSHEVRKNTPFVGQAGVILWEKIEEYTNAKRQHFGIINTVNCRPTDGMRNLKPTPHEMKQCYQWIRKFIKIINPEKILILGNYAMWSLLGKQVGITRLNASDGYLGQIDDIPFVLSIHPASVIYNPDGDRLLRESIRTFSALKTPKKINLPEELFRIE